ncbi:MAG: HAD family hydrolase [Nanoarchaeota archaeon]|nr:HAD family hydrolase [Nanoarchaeota archaeon]
MIICFDVDNTLVRAEPIHIDAFKLAFKKHNLKVPSSRKIRNYFGLVGTVLVKKLFPNLDNKKILEVVKDHDSYVINKTAKNAIVIMGVRRALKKLKSKGYRLALVSNSKHKEINAILRFAKFEKNLFDVIIGNEEVVHPKPNPDMILKAMKKLKEKGGYMVGDTIYDIQAGKKAKLKTIAVLTGQQNKATLKKANPDYIIKSVRKINKILKSPIL